MLVYNITSKVTWAIHDEWVQWMKEEHIPEVIATGCFTDARFFRLLETEEEEGPTYTVQYFAASKELQEDYVKTHANTLRQKAFSKWGNQFISFRSLMEVVQ